MQIEAITQEEIDKKINSLNETGRVRFISADLKNSIDTISRKYYFDIDPEENIIFHQLIALAILGFITADELYVEIKNRTAAEDADARGASEEVKSKILSTIELLQKKSLNSQPIGTVQPVFNNPPTQPASIPIKSVPAPAVAMPPFVAPAPTPAIKTIPTAQPIVNATPVQKNPDYIPPLTQSAPAPKVVNFTTPIQPAAPQAQNIPIPKPVPPPVQSSPIQTPPQTQINYAPAPIPPTARPTPTTAPVPIPQPIPTLIPQSVPAATYTVKPVAPTQPASAPAPFIIHSSEEVKSNVDVNIDARGTTRPVFYKPAPNTTKPITDYGQPTIVRIDTGEIPVNRPVPQPIPKPPTPQAPIAQPAQTQIIPPKPPVPQQAPIQANIPPVTKPTAQASFAPPKSANPLREGPLKPSFSTQTTPSTRINPENIIDLKDLPR